MNTTWALTEHNNSYFDSNFNSNCVLRLFVIIDPQQSKLPSLKLRNIPNELECVDLWKILTESFDKESFSMFETV